MNNRQVILDGPGVPEAKVVRTFVARVALVLPLAFSLTGQEGCPDEDADADGWTTSDGDCDDSNSAVHPGALEICDGLDNDCDREIDEGSVGTTSDCPAADCHEIKEANPEASSGYYHLNAGEYYCEMDTDGGGWTLVRDAAAVWGTGYDTAYFNTEGFTYTEALFQYQSDYVSAHCVYPDNMPSCNNLGFQFGDENWGVAQNWGSSICGMATTDYTTATTYFSGTYDFKIAHSETNATIRLGALEGISYCTWEDNYGTAYVDIFVRR